MNYKQLSDNEILLIEYFHNNFLLSIRDIAKEINRNPSTISRAIKKGLKNNKFSSEKYFLNHFNKKEHKYFFKPQKYKDFLEFLYKVFDKRKNGISLVWWEAKYIRKIETPSLATIYNWINKEKIKIKRNDLTHSWYKKGGKREGGEFGRIYNSKWVLPIGMRPNFINNREVFGNWEGDLIIGKNRRGPHLLTINERISRKGFIHKVRSKNDWKMPWTILELKNNLKWYMYSLTLDNGIEFNRIGIFAQKANVKVFRCDPYCSYQRGSNENFNKLVRKYFPKGFDFSLLSQKEITKVQEEINNKPRKIFKMESANYIHKMCKKYLQKNSNPSLDVGSSEFDNFMEILEYSKKIFKNKKASK